MRGSSRTLAPRIRLCRRLFLAVCTLWALTSAFVAHAGDNTWSPLGPDGGYISKVVFHNTSPGTLYLRASGGFFRSTDGGAHWQQPQPGIMAGAQDFAVDPTDNNRIYLVIGQWPSRVLVSTDAGITFSTLFSFAQSVANPSHIVAGADGSTLYAVCGTSVFRSTDRGTSWQQRTGFPDSFSLDIDRAAIDPSDASTLYIVGDDRLMVTHDAAGAWADVSPSSGGVLHVAVDPTDSNELWVAARSGLHHSSSRGASWSLARSGYTTAVALDPRVPSTVYAAESWGNVRKRSGGTWSDITNNLGSFSPLAIAVSPHDSATVAVANVRGLWITSNGGGSWARSDTGVVSTSIAGFAVAGDRVYTKGNAVTRLDHGADAVTEVDMEGLFQLLSHKVSGIDALAPVLESGSGLIAAIGGRIGRTLDDGATWSLTGYATVAGDQVFDLAATSSAPSVYYASSWLTLQRSIDQGVTWTPIGSGLPAGQSPGLIAIAPGNPSVIYSAPRSLTDGPASGVYKSTNGGDSWTPANTGIEDRLVRAIAVHPTDPNIVYIGTWYEVMKSVDGGASWSELPWPGQHDAEVLAIAIDPHAPDTVYAAGGVISYKVARSTDGGATWTSLAQPSTFFPWQPRALAIDPTRPATLRVGTSTSGIRQMNIRPDLQPDLAIELTPRSTDLPLLAPTEHRFTISNVGPGPTGEVVARIEVTRSGAELAVSPSAGTCTISSFTIDCVAPPLAANATMDIVVSVRPTSSAPLEIIGSVYTDRVDAQLSNNTIKQFVIPVERARLDVNIAGPTTVQAGDSVQYTATITNQGPSPASDVQVSFYTAPGITRGTFSTTAGACVSTGLNTLICEIGTLNAGAAVTLIVNGTIAQAGSYNVNVAALRAGGLGDESALSTNASAPPAPPPPPPPPPSNGGGSSGGGGGGGGGGSTSPLMLLALLVLGLFRAQRLQARRSAGRPRACT